MKKLLSLILAMLMVISCASFVFADDAEAASEDSPYTAAIEFLYNYGIYKGTSADELAADEAILRYQMALFVARVSTGWVDDSAWEDGSADTSGFTDIEASEHGAQDYYGAISYAAQKGIIEGYGNSKFGPDDGITYQDALTMTVRTLGYTGLSYPWGYIEKAVELGLTTAISGVSYTEAINRGVVAQIIYNALFATTKSGEQLSSAVFGITFNNATIIITGADKAYYEATTKLKSPNTILGVDDQDYVSFKILDPKTSEPVKDGETYFVKYSALGISDDHAAEMAVGYSYDVLYEVEDNGDFANIISYTALGETFYNEGKTDDKGEAQDYTIALDTSKITLAGTKYKMVKDFTSVNYVQSTISGMPEIKVYTSNSGTTSEILYKGYIIDPIFGIIYTLVKDADGDYVIDDETYSKEILYTYNVVLDCFYQAKYDTAGNFIGFTYVTEDEVLDKGYTTIKNTITSGFGKITSTSAASAYAKLVAFDEDGDGYYDRAIMRNYTFGKFTLKTAEYNSAADAKVAQYVLTTYAIGADSTLKATDTMVCAEKDSYPYDTDGIKFNTKSDSKHMWFSNIVPETGDYVLFYYDTITGEVDIIKDITTNDDADTYVETAVLRAYSAKNETVKLGDTEYAINYDALAGNTFDKVNKDNTTLNKYSKYLKNLFNQYVEYVVVDGDVVYMAPTSTDSDGSYLALYSYVGFTTTGYIKIYAYNEKGELGLYNVDTVNGWDIGDMYFYLGNYENVQEFFAAGSIYKITSYDNENDTYYLTSINVMNDYKTALYTFTTNGYALKDGVKDHVMAKDDLYVIVCGPMVYTYTGIVPEGWFLNARKVGKFYVVEDDANSSNIFGFDTLGRGVGYVLLDDTKTSIDSAYNQSDILGASVYDIYNAWDIVNGAWINIESLINEGKLEWGCIYRIVNGVIIDGTKYDPDKYDFEDVAVRSEFIEFTADGDGYWGFPTIDGTTVLAANFVTGAIQVALTTDKNGKITNEKAVRTAIRTDVFKNLTTFHTYYLDDYVDSIVDTTAYVIDETKGVLATAKNVSETAWIVYYYDVEADNVVVYYVQPTTVVYKGTATKTVAIDENGEEPYDRLDNPTTGDGYMFVDYTFSYVVTETYVPFQTKTADVEFTYTLDDLNWYYGLAKDYADQDENELYFGFVDQNFGLDMRLNPNTTGEVKFCNYEDFNLSGISTAFKMVYHASEALLLEKTAFVGGLDMSFKSFAVVDGDQIGFKAINKDEGWDFWALLEVDTDINVDYTDETTAPGLITMDVASPFHY